ncbi:HlyD family efflux transporter periplasmic adaptor subunit [Micromonospora sp. NBC_01796]|uniref:HlyD family efflux transporter periplasmic adaptor subunit n=1 Tax=Micromonospora sp. NBC_01796 TaxID=2975987 RepID=UPI002DDBD869|nr:HlyD family efflux transporter periplasmic adaptor subunit [Micromonospora sp. NBC_01796]WSA82960.1 efflux RND transporter periplasmic adaptor subunit [Micromonospora sp. NBC_01796]
MGIGLSASGRAGRGRRVWWLSGVVAVVLVLSGSVAAYALTGDDSEPSRPAATARVDRGDVTLAIATTGALRPAQTRSLGFTGAGTVTEVKVRAGDQVTAGQLLARTDPAAAQQRVDSARDALTEARTALDAAEQRQATPPTTCGPATGNGGTGNGGTGGGAGEPTPSGSATPTTSTRPGSPTPSPAAPSGRVSAPTGTGQSAGQPSGGARDCTGRSGSASTGGPDPVLRAQQQVTNAQLNLDTASDALAGTSITAPIAGKVLSVAGGVGAVVGGGTTFITLGDVAGMEVGTSFPEADAGRLAVGLAATVTLANRPGEEFPARVTQVDPVGTADGQLVRYGALLSFDRVPADALVGQSANARVTIESVPGVLRVPATAVHLTGTDGTGGGPATGEVRLRTPAGGTETRRVTVGVRGDQYAEITDGLAEGDEVVLGW